MLRSALVRTSVIALASALIACDDGSGGIGRLVGVLSAEQTIDFGDVQIGFNAEHTLVVTNTGEGNLRVTAIEVGDNFSTNSHEYKVPVTPFSLAPNDTESLTVSFTPFEAMPEPTLSSFRFVTDIENMTTTINLKGRGIVSGLIVDPDPIDFGNVLPGSSLTVPVRITNAMAFPVDVLSRVDASGKIDIENTSGTGRFEITSPVELDGSMIPGSELLAPQQTITVMARYTPDLSTDGRMDRARWTVANCASSLCEVKVSMIGRGSTAAILCEPGNVDFGGVNPGHDVTRPVKCTNTASDPINIASAALEAGSASGYYITNSGSLPPTLGPNEFFTVQVQYTATQATLGAGPQLGAIIVQGQTSFARPLDPVRVPLTAETGGPTITVLPAMLGFGTVAVGTGSTKSLIVSNDGYTPLVISMIDPDAAMTGAYRASSSLVTLGVGTSTIVRVTFAPTMAGMANSAVVFSSNDSANPELSVPTTGIGIELPPCNYTVTPSMVNFGVVTARTSKDLGVRVQNQGTDDCLMNDIEILDAPNTPSTIFTLINGTETGVVLAGGAAKDIPIRYTPVRGGNDQANLSFYISDPALPNRAIPLFGVGEATTEITCPAAVTTPAGTPVSLTVMATTRGTTVTSYQWAITQAPPGGIGTPNQWTPAPPSAATESFLPYIVGNYTIHVTVTDNLGTSASCDTFVAAEGHGLRVTLGWNGSGDVDLHLNNTTTSPWFTSTNDCYYSNQNPVWDGAFPVSTGPNPDLDFDNTTSNGPENTSVDQPTIGMPYTIGVHNFARSAGRVANITLYCGGVTTPTATFTSRPLVGTDAGNCTTNDFWRVATVVFTSLTTCTVTAIDNYVPSSTACAGF